MNPTEPTVPPLPGWNKERPAASSTAADRRPAARAASNRHVLPPSACIPEPGPAGPASADVRLVHGLPTREEKKADRSQAVSGVVGGILSAVPLATTGVVIGLHEYSHAVAARLLYGTDSTVQVDGFENFGRIKGARTLGEALIATGHWLAAGDANHDGHMGGTLPRDGSRLTALGERFGRPLSDALGSLAGTMGAELPLLALYAVGYKSRDRHPFLGYSLMTLSLTLHAMNMSYAWDAALATQAGLEQKVAQGHDFANAALQIGRFLEIDPTIVSKIIAGGFTAILPAYGLACYLERRKRARPREELIPDAVVLASLYRRAETDPALADKLNNLLDRYPQRAMLEAAGAGMNAWMDSPADRVDIQALKSASDSLSHQMLALNAYLIAGLKEEIRAARASLCRQFGLATGRDTFEKALEVANVGLIGTAAAHGALRAVAAAAPVIAVLGKVFPVLGAIPLSGTYYHTVKDLQNPHINATARKYSVAGSVAAGVGFAAMVASVAASGLGLPVLALGFGMGIVQGVLARGRQQAIHRQIAQSVAAAPVLKDSLGQKLGRTFSSLKDRLLR